MAGTGITAPRVILDPSFLLTEEALDWLADPELQPWLVVSAALVERLSDPEIIGHLREFGIQTTDEHLRRLSNALGPAIARFSHRQSEDIPESIREVRNELVEDGPLGEVLADEWVFLTTQSLGVFAGRVRHTLSRFVRAGTRIYEVTNDAMARGLEAVRDQLPPRLVEVLKRAGHSPARPIPTILMLGGTIAGMIVAPLGLIGVVGAVQGTAFLIGGDP